MFKKNEAKSRDRWETYRQWGRIRFSLFFSIYFALTLSLLSFMMDLMNYGVASFRAAVVRFGMYMVISPVIAQLIWVTSEKRYHKS